MEHIGLLKKKLLKIELVRDIGIADVSKYKKLPGQLELSEYLIDVKSAVVYIAKINDILDKYGKWYVVSLNNYLKQTNQKIVSILEKYQIHACGIIDEHLNKDLIGKISFRTLAVLAGLGTIGKNSCLLHPIYGAQVLIGVVLVNESFLYDNPINDNVCLNCDLCINNCPVQAIHDDHFNRWKCKSRRKILGKGCGTPCLTCCPIGQGT
ncbi:MAG: hypothetical protein ACFFHV_06595 [Promethearchaeota archaeon]